MAHTIIQCSYNDLVKLFEKIAGKEKPLRPVSFKKAKELTGMSNWEIRQAVLDNPKIKDGNNRYRLELLKHGR